MPQSTPVTRSRLPFVAIAVWAAILTAIIAAGLVFGGRNAAVGAETTLGAAGANLSAPLAADPSAPAVPNASGVPGNGNGRMGPRGFAFGQGGPGGPGGFGWTRGPNSQGGPGRGRGVITIDAINGNQLSLKTDDGWARTIDATGATVTERDGTAITVGDLKKGDQVSFRETRNADGSYKITDVTRIPPEVAGTVQSVDANGATVTLPDGSTKAIGLPGSTVYTLRGKAATAADVKVGARIHATGTNDGSGNFTATKVDIAPATVAGTVTAKTVDTNTITITDRSGGSITIHVDGSTIYQTRGKNPATLADVAVDDILAAEGTLNSDGSLDATAVQFGNMGPGGFGGPGLGPNGSGGFGPGKGHGFGRGGGNHADPNASPTASGNAG